MAATSDQLAGLAPGRLCVSPHRHPRHARGIPFGLSLPLEEAACAALFAFFAMQGAVPGLSPAQAHEITGSVPTAYTTISGITTQLIANGLSLLLLIRFPRLLLRSFRTAPLMALLALLAIASTAWSLDPLLTLRRSVPFALAGLFGVWFAGRFSMRRQLSILRLAIIALALATIALVCLDPAIGLDPTPGHASDWRGVFTQKNACGRMMVLGTAVILFDESVTAARLAPLAIFLFVLFHSGSRGAWIVEAAILFGWLLLTIRRRCGERARMLLAVAALPGFAGFLWIAALLFQPLLPLLGRDQSLSGRTAIWPQVLHAIAQRPLLGYGYDAFWRGMQGPSLDVDRAVHFIVEHAHNGLLEIWLELGAAGLTLVLLSGIFACWRLGRLWRQGEIGRIAFPAAFLVLVGLYTLDENTLLIYNGIFWPLHVAALGNIHIAARDHDHKPPGKPHAILMRECDNTPAPVT
jgi:exopolysaccharide production protein ExoQ